LFGAVARCVAVGVVAGNCDSYASAPAGRSGVGAISQQDDRMRLDGSAMAEAAVLEVRLPFEVANHNSRQTVMEMFELPVHVGLGALHHHIGRQTVKAGRSRVGLRGQRRGGDQFDVHFGIHFGIGNNFCAPHRRHGGDQSDNHVRIGIDFCAAHLTSPLDRSDLSKVVPDLHRLVFGGVLCAGCGVFAFSDGYYVE